MSKQVTIGVSEGRQAMGQLVERVYHSDEHLIVEQDGLPVAVLLSYEEYEKLRQAGAVASFERFSRDFGQEAERQGLTESELLEELKEVRQQVYLERYGPRT